MCQCNTSCIQSKKIEHLGFGFSLYVIKQVLSILILVTHLIGLTTFLEMLDPFKLVFFFQFKEIFPNIFYNNMVQATYSPYIHPFVSPFRFFPIKSFLSIFRHLQILNVAGNVFCRIVPFAFDAHLAHCDSILYY